LASGTNLDYYPEGLVIDKATGIIKIVPKFRYIKPGVEK